MGKTVNSQIEAVAGSQETTIAFPDLGVLLHNGHFTAVNQIELLDVFVFKFDARNSRGYQH